MSLISFFLVAKHAAEQFTQHDALDVVVALLSFLFDVNVLQIELIWLLFHLNDYILKKRLILIMLRKRVKYIQGTLSNLKGPHMILWDLKETYALCYRNFQNVKLRLHGVGILQSCCHSKFTRNQILRN